MSDPKCFTDTETLLPCPFCGCDKIEIFCDTVDAVGALAGHYIHHPIWKTYPDAWNCWQNFGGKFDTCDEAAQAWNSRSDIGGAAQAALDPIADRLVDWTYLHATEGQQWPSTKIKSMLIARAMQGEPTQDHADGMKAVAPQPLGDAYTPQVPCPVCGGEAIHAIDVLKRTIIREPLPWDANSNYGYEPVETLAAEIYDSFVYDGPVGTKKPRWTPGGNGLKQDEARFEARRRLRAQGHAPSPTSTQSATTTNTPTPLHDANWEAQTGLPSEDPAAIRAANRALRTP